MSASQSAPGPLGLVKSPQTPTRILMTPYGPFRETAEPPLADPPVVPRGLPEATPVSQPKQTPPPIQLIPSPEPKPKSPSRSVMDSRVAAQRFERRPRLAAADSLKPG